MVEEEVVSYFERTVAIVSNRSHPRAAPKATAHDLIVTDVISSSNLSQPTSGSPRRESILLLPPPTLSHNCRVLFKLISARKSFGVVLTARSIKFGTRANELFFREQTYPDIGIGAL